MYRRSLILVLVAALVACGSVRQPRFGVREGQLAGCDGVPGCVTSQTEVAEQRVAPFDYAVTRSEAKGILLTVLNDMDGITVVSNHRHYVRIEMRVEVVDDFPGASAVIDDVEFYLSPEVRLIHVRAEPRLSRPDTDLNRQRVEEIGRAFRELHSRYRRDLR